MKKHTCKDCPLRYPGCHSKCDAYQQAKELIKQEAQKQAEARGIDDALKWLQNKRLRSFRRRG